MYPRSALLSNGLMNGAGWWEVYHAPPAETTLVKGVTAYAESGTGGRITLWGDHAGRPFVVMSVPGTLGVVYSWEGSFVVPAGANLTFEVVAATAVYYGVSGATLEGTQRFPAEGPQGPFESLHGQSLRVP